MVWDLVHVFKAECRRLKISNKDLMVVFLIKSEYQWIEDILDSLRYLLGVHNIIATYNDENPTGRAHSINHKLGKLFFYTTKKL